MSTVARQRPRVLAEVDGRVYFERGSAAEFGVPDRVAVLVHWSRSPVLSKSVTTFARELDRARYRVVIVSACEAAEPLDWGTCWPPATSVVLRKPNIGYDFGSWAVALDVLPAIARAGHVILTNDSMAGPFRPIDDILENFESTAADVFALTDTRQYVRHIQSYFIGYRRGILGDAPLRQFFRQIRQEPTKWDIIWRNELGLSALLRREGYSIAAAYRADSFVPYGQNPVIWGWWRLLEAGFPFVKREIIRTPGVTPRGAWVANEVRSIFGERIEEWV